MSKKRIRKVTVGIVQGIGMEVPDEVVSPTAEREHESVAVFVCPLCGAKRYARQPFLDMLEELKGIHEAIDAALIRHKPCNTIMHLQKLER